MDTVKQQLYKLCSEYITARETVIRQQIADAREAATNETKSSAGDKYETGREMMQQEIDLNMSRLSELQKQRSLLERVAVEDTYATAQPGAVVYTSNGNYYIAISAGQLRWADTTYYAISAASPIGMQLTGLKKGDTFLLQGKKITIKDVI